MKKLLLLLAGLNSGALKHNLFLRIGGGYSNFGFVHRGIVNEKPKKGQLDAKILALYNVFAKASENLSIFEGEVSKLMNQGAEAVKDEKLDFDSKVNAYNGKINLDYTFSSCEKYNLGFSAGYIYLGGKTKQIINTYNIVDSGKRLLLNKKIDISEIQKMRQEQGISNDEWEKQLDYEITTHTNMITFGPFFGMKIGNNFDINLGLNGTVSKLSIGYKEGFKYDQDATSSTKFIFGFMPTAKLDYAFNDRISVFVEAGYNFAFASETKFKINDDKEAAEFLMLNKHRIVSLKLNNMLLVNAGISIRLI